MRTGRAIHVVAALCCALAVVLVSAACGGSGHPVGGPPPRVPAQPVQGPGRAEQAAPVGTATHAAVRRPNVLVIETDDMRWDELRWMPNVERLIADTGLTFQNSFAPYPLCCPSRASFLSGQYAHNHGVLGIDTPFGFHAFNDRRTIATVLHGAGYQTGLIGKYLNGYGRMPTPRTDRPSLTYVPPGWDQWYAGSDHVWPADSPIQGGTYDYFDLTQNVNGRVETFPGRYTTDVTAEQTRSVIDGFARAGKPWFVWWTPVAPHFGPPAEADDPPPTYNRKGHLEQWPTPARPDWVKGLFDTAITHGLGTPPHHSAEADVHDKPGYIRHNMPELTAAEKRNETNLTRQRAEALWVLDQQIGRTLRELRRTGQYDRTIIMFTSDNGYYLGEHRKRQGKITLHEPSLRVPLLITGPGVPHGQRFDPVTTVDLAPTIAAYAGVRMPKADGMPLESLIAHGDAGWSRAVVTEGRMPAPRYLANQTRHGFNSQLDTRGIRLGRWKLTMYATGEKELYDLKKDPLELHNLDQDPAYAGILKRMTRLWWVYKDCAGAACRAPIPASLRLTAAQERAITVHETAATRTWFSDPALDPAPLPRQVLSRREPRRCLAPDGGGFAECATEAVGPG